MLHAGSAPGYASGSWGFVSDQHHRPWTVLAGDAFLYNSGQEGLPLVMATSLEKREREREKLLHGTDTQPRSFGWAPKEPQLADTETGAGATDTTAHDGQVFKLKR